MTYYEFIEKQKLLNQGPYHHEHHIIPKSCGGTDDKSNLITLSWINHYYAHYYFAKDNPDNKKAQSDFKKKGSLDNWLHTCYVWARDRHGSNNPMFGKTQSDYCKEHNRELNTGKKYSEEINKKKGRAKTEAQKKHLSEMLKGRKDSEETKLKKSISLKGHKGAAEGKHWFNNGQIEKYDFECPEGFIQGRLKRER